jgi:hypothetical protein
MADQNNSKQPVKCPHCGTDVMETGFISRAETTTTYMRFSSGVTAIAQSENVAEEAECHQCGGALPVTVRELRAA